MYNSCSSVVGCLPADLCFVFFQRWQECLGLYVNYPDLFKKTMDFEKYNLNTKADFTWIKGMSLQDLLDKNKKILSLNSVRKTSKGNWSLHEKKLIEDSHNCEDQEFLL